VRPQRRPSRAGGTLSTTTIAAGERHKMKKLLVVVILAAANNGFKAGANRAAALTNRKRARKAQKEWLTSGGWTLANSLTRMPKYTNSITSKTDVVWSQSLSTFRATVRW